MALRAAVGLKCPDQPHLAPSSIHPALTSRVVIWAQVWGPGLCHRHLCLLYGCQTYDLHCSPVSSSASYYFWLGSWDSPCPSPYLSGKVCHAQALWGGGGRWWGHSVCCSHPQLLLILLHGAALLLMFLERYVFAESPKVCCSIQKAQKC